MRNNFCLLAVLFLSLVQASCQGGVEKYAYDELWMSTRFEVVIYSDRGKAFADSSARKAYAVAERLQNKFRASDSNSTLSQLNREGGGKLDAETAEMLSTSGRFYQISGEKFDVTILPLSSHWGFFNEQFRLPSESEIRAVLPKVGFQNVEIHDGNLKLHNGASLDFGAIAKGFAIDGMVKTLQSNGVKAGLVNAGGNLQVFGVKPDASPWKIGIKHPREEGKIYQVVHLKPGESIATSGDYERFFFTNGIRYHHILDPKTGYPMRNGTVSVSVIVSGGELSDVLSTTLFLLGRKKGIAYADSKGLAVLYLEEGSGGLIPTASTNWKSEESKSVVRPNGKEE